MPDKVRRGRRSRFRFTQTPQWALLLQALSDAGYRAYSLLLAHVNEEEADGLVWPHQQTLAAMLGKRSEAVSRVVNRELVPLGLVDVTVERYGANNSRRRNVYTVHEEPPAGWEGIASITEWYAANKPKKAVTAGRPGHAKNRVSGDAKDRASGDAKDRAGNYTKGELDEGGSGGVADAVGQSAGGFARAGASNGAAGESPQAEGGSAASGTDPLPPQRTPSRSPRPRTVKTAPRGKALGFDLVRAAIPTAVARPGTQLYKDLHRAINDLLTGSEGIPRRTPEQVIARINRRWHKAGAEERSALGYRGCDRCTTSGCTSPRQSPENPDGCDRILSKSAWLAVTLIDQDCPDPACEDGQIIGSEETCKVCRERRAQEDAAARAVAEAEARIKADTEALAAARADADAWETARVDEERSIRTRLAQANVYGDKLDHQVARHMAGWRERTPRPSQSGRPRLAAVPAAAAPVDDAPAAPADQKTYGPPPSEWHAARSEGWATVDSAPTPF